MRFVTLLIAAVLLVGGTAGAAPLQAPERADRPAIAISEAGTDAEGRALYNVFADNAEIGAVLKALFARSGDAYGISQDVSGPIDVQLRGLTLDQALQRIGGLASPPLRIDRDGQGYHIRRDAAALENPREGPVRPGARAVGMPAPAVTLPGDRYITIEVPRSRPISLAALVRQMSQQARVPITLDRRVPSDVQFYGHITRASLPLALQTIADTVGLKVVGNGAQAFLVPRDEFTVLLNTAAGAVPFAQSPAAACPRCAAGVMPGWSYCPRCAAPLKPARR